MFDTKLITENPEMILKAMERRGAGYLETFKEAEKQNALWKSLKQEIDGLKHHQKNESKKMRSVKGDELTALRDQLKAYSTEIKEKQAILNEIETKRMDALLNLPNLPDEEIPTGGEENNLEIRKEGTPRKFEFEPKAHWDLGGDLGILEFEAAARMSGSRFSILKGAGAQLERAIINFMLDEQADAGYEQVSPPLIVKREAMVGTGQVPHLEEDTYKTQGDEPFYLIPTAEVVLVNLRREEIIPKEELPVSYVAMTPCFRSEAGSYGRDVRGLIRQHQFYKTELVKITDSKSSAEELEKLRDDAENILKKLGLPYRVMLLSSGDMGFAAHRTYDLEVWLPSENKYREISSCSNCTDFQARRAKIRYRDEAGQKPQLCHTLNGSGLAVGRTLLAVLENYQNSDGTITIPEKLRPYLRNKSKITKNGLE